MAGYANRRAAVPRGLTQPVTGQIMRITGLDRRFLPSSGYRRWAKCRLTEPHLVDYRSRRRS